MKQKEILNEKSKINCHPDNLGVGYNCFSSKHRGRRNESAFRNDFYVQSIAFIINFWFGIYNGTDREFFVKKIHETQNAELMLGKLQNIYH
jgi:hypothetical protein